MVRVFTHKAPRHMDDFMSLCFLKKKLGSDIVIEELSPQDPSLEELKKDPSVFLVDIGQEYNQDLRNFDHHHDLSLPSSLLLVLDYFGLREIFENFEFVRGIDYTDRFGPVEGLKKAGIENIWGEELDRMRKIILLSEPSGELADCFWETCYENLPYHKSWEYFYRRADDLGLLEKGKQALEREEQEFLRKLNQAQVLEIEGLRVIYSLETLSPYHFKVFKVLNADLIVERNSMNPLHTSIIKNTAKPEAKELDLSKVFELYPKVFLHNTGFIAVVDRDISGVDVSEIAKKVCFK